MLWACREAQKQMHAYPVPEELRQIQERLGKIERIKSVRLPKVDHDGSGANRWRGSLRSASTHSPTQDQR